MGSFVTITKECHKRNWDSKYKVVRATGLYCIRLPKYSLGAISTCALYVREDLWRQYKALVAVGNLAPRGEDTYHQAVQLRQATSLCGIKQQPTSSLISRTCIVVLSCEPIEGLQLLDACIECLGPYPPTFYTCHGMRLSDICD